MYAYIGSMCTMYQHATYMCTIKKKIRSFSPSRIHRTKFTIDFTKNSFLYLFFYLTSTYFFNKTYILIYSTQVIYPASMPNRPFNSWVLTQNLGFIRIKNEQRWDLCLLVLSKKQKNTKKNGRKKKYRVARNGRLNCPCT